MRRVPRARRRRAAQRRRCGQTPRHAGSLPRRRRLPRRHRHVARAARPPLRRYPHTQHRTDPETVRLDQQLAIQADG